MPVRTAEAEWRGDLTGGTGTLTTESGTVHGTYSFASRFEDGEGTNPEELMGAAHAGCFAMALANLLDRDGHTPVRVGATARVHLKQDDDGPAISRIDLRCEAEVPGIDDPEFQKHARAAKEECPVSRALAAIPVSLEASLAG